MVSDVLFDAIDEIEEYKKTMPEIYVKNPTISGKVNSVIIEMTRLQMFLDVYNPNMGDGESLWINICNQFPPKE